MGAPADHQDVVIGRGSRASQRQLVLEALRAGAELTALSAALDYGVGRLASRISELIAEGHPIKKRTVLVEKKAGRGDARVTLYWLERGQSVDAP